MHRVVRKKILKFRSKLRSKRFIVGNNQRRFLQMLDHICHRKGLSRTRSSEQGSFVFSAFKKLLDFLNRFYLISSWFIV